VALLLLIAGTITRGSFLFCFLSAVSLFFFSFFFRGSEIGSGAHPPTP
jgi:hypothetical protein